MLMNYWYAVEHASKITPGKPHAIKALGEDLVIWRKQNGDIVAQSDLCVHRGALLSGGELIDDCLVCPYHGWEFNDQGKCEKIPANLAAFGSSRSHLNPTIAGTHFRAISKTALDDELSQLLR